MVRIRYNQFEVLQERTTRTKREGHLIPCAQTSLRMGWLHPFREFSLLFFYFLRCLVSVRAKAGTPKPELWVSLHNSNLVPALAYDPVDGVTPLGAGRRFGIAAHDGLRQMVWLLYRGRLWAASGIPSTLRTGIDP